MQKIGNSPELDFQLAFLFFRHKRLLVLKTRLVMMLSAVEKIRYKESGQVRFPKNVCMLKNRVFVRKGKGGRKKRNIKLKTIDFTTNSNNVV